MNEPSKMESRPAIASICYTSPEGNPCQFIVARNCTQIRETQENGEYCPIPWLEVWDRDTLVARFCQHKVEHILYGARS